MRRVNGILGLLATAVLTMTACGGGGGGVDDRSAAPQTEASTTETAAAPGTLPEQEGPLPAGEYETRAFEPAFSFTVGEGWKVYFPHLPDVLTIVQGTQGSWEVSFSTPKEVFDPSKPAEEVAIPAPETVDGWVAWLQEHPNLDAGVPVPATVGGVSGAQLDVAVSSIPRDYPQYCPAPCVPGWRLSEPVTAFTFFSGDKGRIVVLDVEGEMVIVNAEAPEDEFEEFLPEAQKVLDTVEWGGR
jgi:hypothetical protein